MKFGSHTPESVRDRGTQSPMAVFTRGLQVPGKRWTFAFPNGFGASVINDGYGAESGLYELGVLHNDHLTYETPITDDVLGWLTEDEVAATLDRIAALSPQDVAGEKVRRMREQVAELERKIAAIEREIAAVSA